MLGILATPEYMHGVLYHIHSVIEVNRWKRVNAWIVITVCVYVCVCVCLCVHCVHFNRRVEVILCSSSMMSLSAGPSNASSK